MAKSSRHKSGKSNNPHAGQVSFSEAEERKEKSQQISALTGRAGIAQIGK